MAAIRTVAVIGAGIMGRGIAHAAAIGGYRTILEDLLPNALRRAETEIRANLDKAVELGKVNAAEADAAFARIEYAGSIDQAAREADLVIEAVPEEMESKIEIFTLLDKICRPTTILASNTSGTATITRSASRAAWSMEPAYSMREKAAFASAALTLPSSTALSRLARISVSALRRALGRRSSRMVR